jgi:hypothetical protein
MPDPLLPLEDLHCVRSDGHRYHYQEQSQN